MPTAPANEHFGPNNLDVFSVKGVPVEAKYPKDAIGKTKPQGYRVASLALLAVLAGALQISEARAYMTCSRLERLPEITNQQTAALIKSFAKIYYASEVTTIWQLGPRSYIASATERCKGSSCLFYFAQLDGERLVTYFVFPGDGWIMRPSELDIYYDNLKETYSMVLFQSPEPGRSYVSISVPSSGNLVLLQAWSNDVMGLPRC